MGEKIDFESAKKAMEEWRTAKVPFDNTHFDNKEVPPYSIELSGKLNEWWDAFCIKNRLDPQTEPFREFSYHFIRLGLNAMEDAGGGEISVVISNKKIIATITDQGEGIEDPNAEIKKYPDRGLDRSKTYADEFTVESRGKKYTKQRGKKKLVLSLDTDVEKGTRITLARNLG